MKDLTARQVEIAQLVARGMSSKAIARETGLAVQTVNNHIMDAAKRIPINGPARYRCMIWVLSLSDEQDSDAA